MCIYIYIYIYIYDGGPKKHWNLFIKNCVFILACLNFSPLQSTLHLMQYTYQDVFSTAENSFLTQWFWCLLVLLPFLFYLFHIGKNVSLWELFSSGETKKSRLGQDQVNRECRAQGSCGFCSKTAEHLVLCWQVCL